MIISLLVWNLQHADSSVPRGRKINQSIKEEQEEEEEEEEEEEQEESRRTRRRRSRRSRMLMSRDAERRKTERALTVTPASKNNMKPFVLMTSLMMSLESVPVEILSH